MLRGRLIPAFTALCVAWTSLWPLVSSAQALLAGDETRLCHQAGQAVPIGLAPMLPDDGTPAGEAKVHCPLCVMAFLGACAPGMKVPPAAFFATGVTLQPHCAAVPPGIEVFLPQGRAPPLPLLPA